MNALSSTADAELARARLTLVGAIALLTLWRIWVITHSGITLYVDEAYYWGWSRELAWGYFSKPPMIAGLIALTTAFLGDGLIGVKAASLILYPATALLLFGLGRRLYDVRTALFGALAFLILPITSALGLFASTDAPLLFCWTAALWALHVALKEARLRDWLLLGLICGLGLMSKYTMAAFLLSALVLLLGTPEGRAALKTPGPWLTAVVALAILAPNLWWNWQNDFPTFRHTAEITHHEAAGSKGNTLEFIGAQFGAIGPLLALGLVGALFSLRRAWQHEGDRLLVAGTLPLLLLVIAQSFTSEANANWAGPIYASGSLLAVAWLRRGTGRHRLLIAALVLNLAITVVLYHSHGFLNVVARPVAALAESISGKHWPALDLAANGVQSAKLDPLKRMKGWDRLVQGFGPIVLSYPDAYIVADERTLLAHTAYGLRSMQPRIASWNPEHAHHDQYQITHSLPDTPGLDILYLAQKPPAEVAARFAQSEELARLRVTTHPDFALETSVWLMRGFKGY